MRREPSPITPLLPAFAAGEDGPPPARKTRPRPRLCRCCGARLQEYKHGLTRPLLAGLLALGRSGGPDRRPVNLRDLQMPRTQWDNFQKLRYWDLVRQVGRKSGVWQITNRGRAFLQGALALPKSVWTYRGERVRYDGPLIRAADVDGGYQARDQWAEESQPHPAP